MEVGKANGRNSGESNRNSNGKANGNWDYGLLSAYMVKVARLK